MQIAGRFGALRRARYGSVRAALAVFVSLALVQTAVELPADADEDAEAAASGQPNPDQSSSGEAASAPYVEPALGPEVVSLRDATSKTFTVLGEPGRYISKVSLAPVHFRDEAGDWQEIDTTLAPSPPDGRLRTRANSVSVDLAPVAADPQLARVDFDASHSVAFALDGAGAAPATVAGSVATYAAALPDVAVELRAIWSGLKEELVLTSPSAPDTYVFPLTLPAPSL